MPTNSRTPSIPSTGGGSTSNVCSISPSDNVGNVNSLTKRVEELEKAVSKLLGRNVTANQLSDLSQQVGWVNGVSYMGTEGWTQTEYGTLIPPAGWSLSSLGLLNYAGNPYQAGAFDSDHAPIFAVAPNGTLFGERVTAWNNAAVGSATYDYGYAFWSYPTWDFNGARGMSLTVQSITGGNSSVGEIEFTIATTGLYFCYGFLTANSTTNNTSVIFDSLRILKNGNVQYYAEGTTETPAAARKLPISTGGVLPLSNGDTVTLKTFPDGSAPRVELFGFSVAMFSN